MILLIVSFVAGMLTVLAPCVLPLLPVTLGSAMGEAGNKRRPLIIIGSLSVSVFVFTLLLKGSTALIGASPSFWNYISAAIILAFGLTLLFPITWAKVMLKLPGHNKPDSWMAKGYQSRGHWWADILVGAALGPVFTTCSPTFFLILATVLPQSLSKGIIDLLAYIIGLAISLLFISWIGQKLIDRLGWAIDPNGWFRKTLGVLFIIMAVAIMFGFDKKIEADILNSGFFDVTTLEQSLHQSLEAPRTYSNTPVTSTSTTSINVSQPTSKTVSGATQPDVTTPIPGEQNEGKYIEIAKPAGFVNSAPFKLSDFVGKKVILIDFIDYSCINCERTFPFLNDWWTKYQSQGLEIVAIHTPEFSFEKDINNVTAAAKQYGLKFPIVLDNDYGTWNAYQNEYWPHKFLIDIHGNIVYDKIGEGGDDQVESEIVKQLNIAHQFLGDPSVVVKGAAPMPDYSVEAESPETYFGAERNEYFGNGAPGVEGDDSYTTPSSLSPNQYYLGGKWHVDKEYAQENSASSTLSYVFTATNMNLVAATADGSTINATVLLDGKPIPDAWAGSDVKGGVLKIGASRLYDIYNNSALGQHRIYIIFSKPGAQAYTFTFG